MILGHDPWAWVGLTADVVLPAVSFVSRHSDIISVYEQFRLYRSALFRFGTMPKDPFFVLVTQSVDSDHGNKLFCAKQDKQLRKNYVCECFL